MVFGCGIRNVPCAKGLCGFGRVQSGVQIPGLLKAAGEQFWNGCFTLSVEGLINTGLQPLSLPTSVWANNWKSVYLSECVGLALPWKPCRGGMFIERARYANPFCFSAARCVAIGMVQVLSMLAKVSFTPASQPRR